MNDKYCFCSQLYKGGYITYLQNCLYLGFKLRLILASVQRFRERLALAFLAFARLLLPLSVTSEDSFGTLEWGFDSFWNPSRMFVSTVRLRGVLRIGYAYRSNIKIVLALKL